MSTNRSSVGVRRAAMMVRTGWALALLAAPGPVVRVVGGRDEPASRWVVRVLGARHLVEAAVEIRHGRGVRRAGAAIDGIHSCTAMAFGLADRRWRRPALIDAGVAAAFAALGLAVADS